MKCKTFDCDIFDNYVGMIYMEQSVLPHGTVLHCTSPSGVTLEAEAGVTIYGRC